MRRITTALLLGAAAAVALAPLLACEDDTTVNTAFKDAGGEAGKDGGEAGKDGGADAADAASDAADGADGD
jgi:hypothetical protein